LRLPGDLNSFVSSREFSAPDANLEPPDDDRQRLERCSLLSGKADTDLGFTGIENAL
jgi:hypothetical protein